MQVGYCQSMNYLAAMLLLALGRDEEAAFWVLVVLIDDGGAQHPPVSTKPSREILRTLCLCRSVVYLLCCADSSFRGAFTKECAPAGMLAGY